MEIKELNPKDIIYEGDNPREELDEEFLKELGDSVASLGQQQAISVYKLPNNKFGLIVGYQRWKVALKLDKPIMAQIEERRPTQYDLTFRRLAENLSRRDLKPNEISKTCKQLMRKYPNKFPSISSIAVKLGVPRTTLSTWVHHYEAEATLRGEKVTKFVTQEGLNKPPSQTESSLASTDSPGTLMKSTIEEIEKKKLQRFLEKTKQETDPNELKAENLDRIIKMKESKLKELDQQIEVKENRIKALTEEIEKMRSEKPDEEKNCKECLEELGELLLKEFEEKRNEFERSFFTKLNKGKFESQGDMEDEFDSFAGKIYKIVEGTFKSE